MAFKKLEYSDREKLAPILRAKNSFLSEYSFTNAYLFREPHKYEVATCGDCTFLRGVTYDGFKYMMPVCPIESVPFEKLLILAAHTDFFFPIQENWLRHFPESHFEYSYKDGDSDYIYLTERLATMAGRKLSKKRNLIKQYSEAYDVLDLPLTKKEVPDALKVLDVWLEEIREESDGNDYDETKEALEKIDAFRLRGLICYADGKPSGFVLGEELNDETFALHFAKGCRTYKGIYQHMYNAFAKTISDSYRLVNFEQDLGKDSLKQAKSTYYPDEMMKKYRVKLKNA